MAEEEVKVVQVEKKSWYNNAEGFDKWRVFPRILITLYGVMFYKTSMWFMTLPDPSVAQSGLVSICMGALTGCFGIWMNKEAKTDRGRNSTGK